MHINASSPVQNVLQFYSEVPCSNSSNSNYAEHTYMRLLWCLESLPLLLINSNCDHLIVPISTAIVGSQIVAGFSNSCVLKPIDLLDVGLVCM